MNPVVMDVREVGDAHNGVKNFTSLYMTEHALNMVKQNAINRARSMAHAIVESGGCAEIRVYDETGKLQRTIRYPAKGM